MLYGSVGVFGYAEFGNTTKGNILQNYPSSNLFINIARVCMTITAVFSYPLMNYVNRKVMEYLLVNLIQCIDYRKSSILSNNNNNNKKKNNNNNELEEEGAEYWIRTVLISFILMSIAMFFALLLPQIQLIFGLAGSIVIVIVTFILPCILHWYYHSQYNTFYGKIFPVIIVIMGCVIGILGTIATVIDVYDYFYDLINNNDN